MFDSPSLKKSLVLEIINVYKCLIKKNHKLLVYVGVTSHMFMGYSWIAQTLMVNSRRNDTFLLLEEELLGSWHAISSSPVMPSWPPAVAKPALLRRSGQGHWQQLG